MKKDKLLYYQENLRLKRHFKFFLNRWQFYEQMKHNDINNDLSQNDIKDNNVINKKDNTVINSEKKNELNRKPVYQKAKPCLEEKKSWLETSLQSLLLLSQTYQTLFK